MKIVKILFILVLSSFVLSSCEKDDEIKVSNTSIKVNKLEGSALINDAYNDSTYEVVFFAVYDRDFKTNSDLYYSGYYEDEIYVKYGTDSSLKNAEMVNLHYDGTDNYISIGVEVKTNKKYYYQVCVKISPRVGNVNNEEFWVYDKIREFDLMEKDIFKNMSIKADYLGPDDRYDRQVFSISVTGSPFGKEVPVSYDFWHYTSKAGIMGGFDPEKLYTFYEDSDYQSLGVWNFYIDNRDIYVGEVFYYKPYCRSRNNPNVYIYGELSSVVLK